MSCCNESRQQTDVTAITQQNSQTDCFVMHKIYDWVKKKMEQTALVIVPAADLPAIKAAIEAGDTLEVTGFAVSSEIKTSVALIERVNDYCACVQFRKNIPLHVSIYDQTTSTMLSEFTKTVQEFDSCKLCFPVGMPDDAITVKVVGVDAGSLSTTPVDGSIAFLLSICQEIIVGLDVMVKIKVEGLCSSRQGFSCLGSVSCEFGTPVYPAQCPSSTTCS